MTDTIYYFDGEDGCTRCQSRTGYYLFEPSRPHDHCDCDIEAIDIEDLGGRVELRELSIEEEPIWIDWRDSLDNCDDDGVGTLAVRFAEDVAEDVEADLLELAEDSGWEVPEPQQLDYALDVPGGHWAQAYGAVIRQVTEFFAEEWLIVTLDDGTEVEHFLGVRVGYHAINVSHVLTSETHDCDAPPQFDEDRDGGGPAGPFG